MERASLDRFISGFADNRILVEKIRCHYGIIIIFMDLVMNFAMQLIIMQLLVEDLLDHWECS